MNTPRHHDDSSPDRRETDSRGISFNNLVADLARVGPAPSRAREAAVIVSTFVFLGVVAVIAQPRPVIIVAVAAAFVVYHVIRWIAGVRTWGRR